MSIQKKSLINTLNTTKKAIVASNSEKVSTSAVRNAPVRRLRASAAGKLSRTAIRTRAID